MWALKNIYRCFSLLYKILKNLEKSFKACSNCASSILFMISTYANNYKLFKFSTSKFNFSSTPQLSSPFSSYSIHNVPIITVSSPSLAPLLALSISPSLTTNSSLAAVKTIRLVILNLNYLFLCFLAITRYYYYYYYYYLIRSQLASTSLG